MNLITTRHYQERLPPTKPNILDRDCIIPWTGGGRGNPSSLGQSGVIINFSKSDNNNFVKGSICGSEPHLPKQKDYSLPGAC